jgi:two-component system, OmpR family, sensor histidine kinase BaeS
VKVQAGEPRRRRDSLAARLLVAQTIVLLTGTVTAWLIALAVGPTLFHRHFAQANVGTTPALNHHAEQAYQSANAISLSLALLTSAVDSVAEAYRAKGVRLVVEPSFGLEAVQVDPDRFGQVLGNLLDNALRHTPADGTVTVSARSSARGGTELAVADTGDGIPAEHLPHVFERFYRVDSARNRDQGGSGIGLAIAKAFVEAHGGQLSVTSAGTGHGSVFRIWLPR